MDRTQAIDRPWGSERLLAVTELYAWRMITLRRAARVSLHYHRQHVESLYVVQGRSRYQIGNLGEPLIERILGPGDVIHHRPYQVHRHEALEPLVLMEVSSPPFDDIVRVEDDYGRADAREVVDQDLRLRRH